MIADFTSSTAATNVILCGVFIDGSNEATAGVHVSRASSFISVVVSARRGAGLSSGPAWAAGDHTITVQVAHNVTGANTTCRTSTSVELTIIEYEPS